MKFFYIIALVLFVNVITAAPPTDQTEREKNVLKKAHDECQANPETQVDVEAVKNLNFRERVTNLKLQKHALCINVKIGLLQENGDVNIKALELLVRWNVDDETKAKKIIEECSKRPTGSPGEAALAFDHCMMKNTEFYKRQYTGADTEQKEKEKKVLKKAHDECQANPETQIDVEAVKNLNLRERVNNEKLQKHALCINVKIGLLQENGDVNIKALGVLVRWNIIDDKKANKIIEECSKRPAGSPGAAALAFDHCMMKNTEFYKRHYVGANTDQKDKQKQALKKAHDECQANPETKVDVEAIKKLTPSERLKNINLQKHALCINVKVGLQQENGDVIIKALGVLVRWNVEDDDKANKIIQKCGTRTGGTPGEAAVAFDNCMIQNTEFYVGLKE